MTVFNMNAPSYVHRVQLSPSDGPRMRIKQIQITSQNDIFAFTHQESSYKIFMIDLDASDIQKIKELKKNPYSLYYEGKRMPVLEYEEKDVNNEPFVLFHCRGSSSK